MPKKDVEQRLYQNLQHISVSEDVEQFEKDKQRGLTVEPNTESQLTAKQKKAHSQAVFSLGAKLLKDCFFDVNTKVRGKENNFYGSSVKCDPEVNYYLDEQQKLKGKLVVSNIYLETISDPHATRSDENPDAGNKKQIIPGSLEIDLEYDDELEQFCIKSVTAQADTRVELDHLTGLLNGESLLVIQTDFEAVKINSDKAVKEHKKAVQKEDGLTKKMYTEHVEPLINKAQEAKKADKKQMLDALKDFITEKKLSQSNSTGIAKISKIIENQTDPVKAWNDIQKLANEKTHGVKGYFGRSNIFGKGRHKEVDGLYEMLSTCKSNTQLSSYIESHRGATYLHKDKVRLEKREEGQKNSARRTGPK